jgi:4-hydroxythreonine-4-phosphate dehydrogenase
VKPRVAITVGDPAGIGPEIARKAADDPRVRDACEPVLYGPPAEHTFPVGELSADAGRAAFDAICAAVRDAQRARCTRSPPRPSTSWRSRAPACLERAHRPARPPHEQPSRGDDVLERAAESGARDDPRTARVGAGELTRERLDGIIDLTAASCHDSAYATRGSRWRAQPACGEDGLLGTEEARS